MGAVAIDVKTGATNGRVTEVTGGALKAGMQVITEALSAQP
jgi:HlyD family secretion protein